jgi:hypothetical protein
VLTSSGGYDAFVAKISSTGTPLWARSNTTGNATEFLLANTLIATSSGDVYISLNSNSTDDVTFGSTVISNPTATGKHIVAKLNTNGDWKWAINSGTTGAGSLLQYGIVVNNNGEIITIPVINAGGTWATVPPTVLSTSVFNSAFIKVQEDIIVAPQVKTSTLSTYTMVASDQTIIFTNPCTVTLLPANSAPGRMIYIKNITATVVTSATANVIPQASLVPGTAILAATAGKWAMLQSNGINWVVIMSN